MPEHRLLLISTEFETALLWSLPERCRVEDDLVEWLIKDIVAAMAITECLLPCRLENYCYMYKRFNWSPIWEYATIKCKWVDTIRQVFETLQHFKCTSYFSVCKCTTLRRKKIPWSFVLLRFRLLCNCINEPAQEIMVLIGEQRRLRRDCADAQSRQSFRCSHTQRMEVDEGSDQISDI